MPTAAATRLHTWPDARPMPTRCIRRGGGTQAAARFAEAEAMQAERQPDYPLLYSV